MANVMNLRNMVAAVKSSATAGDRWTKVLESAGAVVELAELARRVRGRPRPVDMLALGLKTAHVGTKLYKTWAVDREMLNLSRYFVDDQGVCNAPWVPVPQMLAVCAFGTMSITGEPQPGWINAMGENVFAVRIAEIEPELRLGWTGNATQSPPQTQCYAAGEDAIRRIEKLASETLWRAAGGKKALSLSWEAFAPLRLPEGLIRTEFLAAFSRRVRAFWDKGVVRSYLLEGEPRVGKTLAALFLAEEFGASLVSIDAQEAGTNKIRHGTASMDGPSSGVQASPWVAVEYMKPDIIVLNDLDHLPEREQLALFGLLEKFRGIARILLVTANDPSKLAPPLRGPGRVDDIISVPGLSLEEVERIIGTPDARFVGWPIAYVQDWLERKRVLGLDEYDAVAGRLATLRAAMSKATPTPDGSTPFKFKNGFAPHNEEDYP